jgi:hypothetical protein
MKEKAIKKVQIAIDKMVDLQDDFIDNPDSIVRILEALRTLESRITESKMKNGRLVI